MLLLYRSARWLFMLTIRGDQQSKHPKVNVRPASIISP